FALGGLGPMLFGMHFTFWEGDKKAWRDYWFRVVDFKRLGFRGWFLSLLAVPLLTLFAGWVDTLLGGSGLRLDLATPGYFIQRLPGFAGIPAFLMFMLLFGPLPEELGWRGYALDRLRVRYGSFKAGLILGLLWGLWHLPLFFLKGAYQSTLGVGTVGFFLFFAAIVPLSVVMTWVYDVTKRSILSAVLLHFSVNVTGTVAAHGNRVELLEVVICWIWALSIAGFWKREGAD
ncbi:MAG TPA: CPBP family intramembrane glutamic endopeptidase, partial [bacterium]|nr:CPBP family intramembrane glutamic endopeptidase [bacterium]